MANEFAVTQSAGKVIYVILRRLSDLQVYDVGDSAMEAVGTWDNARCGECDIVLTYRSSYLYTADFPNVGNGVYIAIYFEQIGGSPAITDRKIYAEKGYWNGTDFWTRVDVVTVLGNTPISLNEINPELSD